MSDEEVTTAAAELDKIRAGGQQVLVNVRMRLAEVLTAIEEGRFCEGVNLLNEAGASLAPLANAQSYVAIADGSYLSRARDLEVGMQLKDVGEITSVEKSDCLAHGDDGHVVLKVSTTDQAMQFRGHMLLYVVKGESGA